MIVKELIQLLRSVNEELEVFFLDVYLKPQKIKGIAIKREFSEDQEIEEYIIIE